MNNIAWNFHGYIAVPLANTAKQILPNTTYSADSIETGNFVRAMYAILTHLKIEDILDFVFLCEKYTDKPANEIPPEDAQRMFDEFNRIIESAN